MFDVEKFLSRKVEMWVLGLLLILGIIAMVIFGSMVRTATDGDRRYGRLGTAAVMVADLPTNISDTVKQVTAGNKAALAAQEQRFEGQSGFDFSYPAGSRDTAGYLLLSRYDGDEMRSLVDLFDLNTQKVIHTWRPDFAAQNALAQVESNLTVVPRDNAPNRARIFHPLMTEDGDIIFENMTPLVSFDACDQLNWGLDGIFHHSVERHPEDGYWVSSFLEPPTLRGVKKTFKEDAITHVSSDGDILFQKSVPQILIENGLGRLVHGLDFYSDDPLHLNDVQFAPTDTEYWKAGDLFLSLRNVSAIVQYRPSTNEVIWYKEGPWVNQHDVDVLDDHRISVFNNSRYNFQYGAKVHDSNDVMIYDFETDTVTSPYKDAMMRLDVRTTSEGRSEILPNGDVVIEESNFGRLMQIGEDGKVVWSYVNRASDGKVYLLNWTRHVPRDYGDAVAAKLAGMTCG